MKGVIKKYRDRETWFMSEQLGTGVKKWKGEYRTGKIIEGEAYEWINREREQHERMKR